MHLVRFSTDCMAHLVVLTVQIPVECHKIEIRTNYSSLANLKHMINKTKTKEISQFTFNTQLKTALTLKPPNKNG